MIDWKRIIYFWKSKKHKDSLQLKRELADNFGFDYWKIDFYKQKDSDNPILKNHAVWYYNDKGKHRYFGIFNNKVSELDSNEDAFDSAKKWIDYVDNLSDEDFKMYQSLNGFKTREDLKRYVWGVDKLLK